MELLFNSGAVQDLVERALSDKLIGGKPATDNHKQMARMMCRVEENGTQKTAELLPEGSFTALRLAKSSSPNDFFETHTIILNTPIDVMGKPVLVCADSADGIFFLRTKRITDDIDTTMDSVIGINAKPEEAASNLWKLIKEGKIEQVKLNDLIKSASESSAKAVLAKGEMDVETGLFKEDRLKVLKTFFSPIVIESDFDYKVEGSRNYNAFTRKTDELEHQIKAIRERYHDEIDPMKKHTMRIQLKIIEKFRDKRVSWERTLAQGKEWQNWLNDKRSPINRTDVKFDIRRDVVKKYSDRLVKKEWERIKETADSRDSIDIKQLESDVISWVADMAFLAYMQNSKFDLDLKPIRG